VLLVLKKRVLLRLRRGALLINLVMLILQLDFIEACAPIDSPAPTSTQIVVPLSTLQKGNFSGIREALRIVIRDQDHWDKFWKRHSSIQTNPPPPPHINFTTEMVVGLFADEKGMGGYEVEITGAELKNSSLYVHYVERSPPRDAIVTQTLTQPFHLVKLPRYDTPVIFFREGQ
jgi:hypothetical protein